MTLFRTRRARMLAIIGGIALLAVGYTAYWYSTAYRLGVRLEAWAAARRAEGYHLKWDALHLSGFPGAMRFTLVNASLQRGNPTIYQLDFPQISTSAMPWDLRYWKFEAPKGAHMVISEYPDPIEATGLDGQFALTPGDYVIAVVAHELNAGTTKAVELDTHLTVPRESPRNHRERGLAATIELWNLVLPKPVKPLGDKIESFGVAIDFMGALPHQGELRDSLTKWRDDGGVVEIKGAALHWGALTLETNGTVALDSAMQPMAGLSASIVDQDSLVDATVTAGIIQAKNAPLVKLVLTLLAKEGPDGRSRVTAPITVQDGKVFIGKAQIAEMPKIELE